MGIEPIRAHPPLAPPFQGGELGAALIDAATSRSPLPGREGLGVGAAEALGGSTHDRLKHALGVLIELIVPDAEDCPALRFKKAVALLISLRFIVLAAVEFDHQPGLPAREIGKVRADWQLAREFRPHSGQDSPQLPLMLGGIVAKRARALRSIE